MRQINFFLAITALLLISSCTNDDNTTPPTTTITIAPSSIALSTTDTTSVSATISPSSLTPDLIWSSSNSQIATVSSQGLVTAMSAGTTTIKATIGNTTAECPVTVNAAVYAVGTIENSNNAPIGLLWRDGVVIDTITTSTEYGYLQGVALDNDNNIYIAGYTSTNGPSIPFVWENGVSSSLQTVGSNGYPTSMGVYNNNVYISGILNSGQQNIATIWENGVANSLTDGTQKANANALFVYGDTTYVVGYTDSSTASQTAVLWKNGVATNLSNGTENASALDIFIADGIIYICGYDGDNAVIWENGVEQIISTTDNGAKALAIAVSSSADVYAVGYAQNSDYAQIATLWKNGVAEQLNSTAAVASDIFINGSDVYVAGEIYGTTTPASTAAVWKNGTLITYSDGTSNGDISAIFVK